MKKMYCWRCDEEVLMLDEQEFEQLSTLLSQCVLNVKEARKEGSLPLSGVDFQVYFKPALECYEGLTGVKETNHERLWHHRISLFGTPCPSCGLPLRTPGASMCAKCGWNDDREPPS